MIPVYVQMLILAVSCGFLGYEIRARGFRPIAMYATATFVCAFGIILGAAL
jgi:hypothetical protein